MAGAARAEAPAVSGVDAHGFQLVAFDGDVRDGLLLPRPGAFEAGSWWVGALLERAEAPLVWIPIQDGEAGDPQPLVDDLYAVNLSFGGAVHQRVRFDVAAPIALASAGADGSAQGAAMGDARFTTMVALVRPEGGGLGLGLAPWVDLPVGSREHLLGQQGLGGGAQLGLTWERGPWTLTGAMGYAARPAVEVENLTGSDLALAGLGLGWARGDRLGATVEARGGLPVAPGERAASERPAELVGLLRGRGGSGVHWTVGGASALSSGAGAARYRLFVGGGFGRAEPPARDADMDLVLDVSDACPDAPETPNGWRDGDGCPDALSTVSVRVERDGAPVEAALRLEGPAGAREGRAAGGAWTWTDLPPETRWWVAASQGCWGAEAELTTREGDQTLTLVLQPARSAALIIEARRDGAPEPNAAVLVEADDPACAPAAPLVLDAEARAQAAVGPGALRVTVSHPEAAPWQTSLQLAPGDEATVTARLLPRPAPAPVAALVILDRVSFAPGKAQISPDGRLALEAVAALLAAHPELHLIEVSGHTDDREPGGRGPLAQRRAEAVRDALVAAGVAPERLAVRAYGAEHPLDDNEDPEGRAANRRVEFQILARQEE